MRLQKYIVSCGFCSRRNAEKLISDGRVTINGRVASLGDSMENDGDIICLDGKPLVPPARHTYIMLHKPRGYVTTLSDEQGRPTVAELVADVGTRLFPVGRLDLQSEGLLILTDDGEIANRLAHPSYGVRKTYRVTVHGGDFVSAVQALQRPITYEGVSYQPAEVSVVRRREHRTVLDITVSEGKNREVRNMCAAVGLSVERLIRIRQGDLFLGDLPMGKWRFLSEQEMEYLQHLI